MCGREHLIHTFHTFHCILSLKAKINEMIMSMVMNNSTVNIVINNPCCNNPFLQLAVYKMINDS